MALLDTIVQSVVLSVFSNVVAQLMSAYQDQVRAHLNQFTLTGLETTLQH
jgi:hypothetical protein